MKNLNYFQILFNKIYNLLKKYYFHFYSHLIVITNFSFEVYMFAYECHYPKLNYIK